MDCTKIGKTTSVGIQEKRKKDTKTDRKKKYMYEILQ